MRKERFAGGSEMKDENGIEICCKNCRCVCKYDSMCLAHTPPSFFRPTSEALEARIQELQEHNDILQKRVSEFSMELLDYNMKENKDVLERLKNWEENDEK